MGKIKITEKIILDYEDDDGELPPCYKWGLIDKENNNDSS